MTETQPTSTINRTPYHNPVSSNGIEYNLNHLNPIDMSIDSEKSKRILRVHIVFSNHCFTKKLLDGQCSSEVVFKEKNRQDRYFCPQRYDLSKSLPEIISSLNHKKVKVYQTTSRRNWLHSIKTQIDGQIYCIFFEIRRSHKPTEDVRITVESAYPVSAKKQPAVIGSMGFILLVGKIYLNEPTTTRR